MFTIKHKDKTFKQTYEERLISSHIGYIDKYRLFLLNEIKWVEEPEKRKINANLVRFIERYVKLFESNMVHKSNFSKQTLIPFFNSTICKIKNSDFRDISTQISSNP